MANSVGATDVSDVIIRPLTPADIPLAELNAYAALRAKGPSATGSADPEVRAARARARIAHLHSTDPGGAFVAEVDGTVVGVCLALIRDGLWLGSLMGIHPGLQSRGIGRQLLTAALAYGSECSGAMLVASADPRMIRLYVRFGFAARPCLSASGHVQRARLPAGLRSRPGDLAADRDLIDATGRDVRGATYAHDLDTLLEAACDLLVLDGRGFVVHNNGSPVVLVARDEDAASDLLWSSLACAPDEGQAHVLNITQGNAWATMVAVAAGLELAPSGPMFVRGRVAALAPYLPSGRFL
jgi:ribosomal protein S18 acetylase RimI-like enzyme